MYRKMGIFCFLSFMFFSIEAHSGKKSDCKIKDVKKAAKEMGKKGLLKAMGVKPVKGGKGCDAKKAVISYRLVGHFTQKDCAELMVLWHYAPGCGKDNEPDHMV